MEKLDRLGWAVGLVGSAWGMRLGVRATAPELLAELQPYLPPVWRPAAGESVDQLFSLKGARVVPGRSGVKQFHLAYAGPSRIARTLDLIEALEQLETQMNITVATGARQKLFIHAGAVGWRGRAIIFPGRTMSGKSSLTAALLRAGAEYLSDEYAVFDYRGRIHPYPRRLALRDETGLSTRRATAAELGGTTAKQPLPLGMVLVSEYREGASGRFRAMTSGQTVLSLLHHAAIGRRQPKTALTVLHRAVRSVPTVRVTRGDADAFVERMLGKLADW